MKKTILTLVVCSFIVGSFFTSCNSPAQNVEDANINVENANNDLDKANAEYLADIQNYRLKTAEKVAANDKSLVAFKARIAHEKKEAKSDYNKKIAALEQKNSDLKKKMDDYKEEGKEKWEIFKSEFSHDMDELGNAFKDITVKNVK